MLYQSLFAWIFWADSIWFYFWPSWTIVQYLQNLRGHAHQNWCTCITHQPLLAWIFWSNSNWLNCLMTMDYIYMTMSMAWEGNLAVFESSNISKTKKAMPTKIGVHTLHINLYLHEFLSQFCCFNFWWPWTIVHGLKRKFGCFWK